MGFQVKFAGLEDELQQACIIGVYVRFHGMFITQAAYGLFDEDEDTIDAEIVDQFEDVALWITAEKFSLSYDLCRKLLRLYRNTYNNDFQADVENQFILYMNDKADKEKKIPPLTESRDYILSLFDFEQK